MQQPLALPIRNVTIFWEHEVFIDCCHSNTATYIFSVFSSKQCENNGKNYSFNLGLFTIFLFCHPYATIPNVSLNLV